MPKYLGIGGPKTGSVSLNLALNACGIDSTHCHLENVKAVDAIQQEDFDAARQIWQPHDCWVDGPMYNCTPQQLIQAVDEDTIFIHHTRDHDTAVTSAMIHVLDSRLTAKARSKKNGWEDRWTSISTVKMYQIYRQADRVAEGLREKGRQVITVNLCEEHNSWETFCPLFGFETPNEPFPMGNTGVARMERLLEHYRRYGSKPAPASDAGES